MRRRRLRRFLLLFLLMLTACMQPDTIIYQPSRRWVEKTVAVVAPLSADTATRQRFERTAQWFLDNLHAAQLRDTLCISLKIEWHDELTEDLGQLGESLAHRDDVTAVVGPFSNDGIALLAPPCQETQKTVIAPTATSEEVIRRFAVGTAGVKNKRPFLWALTETDITFCEVMMNMYASFIKALDFESDTPVALFAPDDSYGRTFTDWGPYQAEEMGIPLSIAELYTDDADLHRRMKAYYTALNDLPTFHSYSGGNFCVIETTRQLYDMARMRMEWWELDPDEPLDGEGKDDMQSLLEGWCRSYFAFTGLTQESLDALGPLGADVLQYYQGFSPYADPTTGFEMSYEVKFGTKPTFAECKFYDALLLTAFAASYDEHNPTPSTDDEPYAQSTRLNAAIIAITTPHRQPAVAAWNATAMELYLSALEQGRLTDFKGASGDIRFDTGTFTSSVATTYVHWQIQNGRIEHRHYFSSDGTHRTSPTMAAWSWLVTNAEESFAKSATDADAPVTYPPLAGQYAVLVQGSSGWNNYRHQADVLSVYQMLKRNGFDDSHIIVILDKALASDARNPEPGTIRADDEGPDLMDGAVIDYDNALLTPADIADILLGRRSSRLPTTLPSPAEATDTAPNVLLFWSGHGHSLANGGTDELAWLSTSVGQGMTADLLRQTVSQMQQQGLLRKMLVLAESCYSEAVVTHLAGIPGVLGMTGAGAAEQSFADAWSSDLGVWRCDRFSHNLVTHLTASPATTYRDLYLYCARHTLGSHVRIVNADLFDNLYTTGPQEFIHPTQP